jgi:catechol 2,3-dioxygenase
MSYHQPPAAFVSSAVLRVKDLEKSIKFYKETLGFHVEKPSESCALISADRKNILLTLQADPDFKRPAVPKNGLFHLAFLLPDRASLGAVLKHLVERNYPLQGASDHGVSEALYLADPEGNGIELYCDRPASSWKWQGDQVQMTTQALDAEGLLAEASVFEGMPAETILGHIHLQVNDIKEGESFYIDSLNFDRVSTIGDHALFISTDAYHHHIAMNTWSGRHKEALSEDETGLASFQIVYPDNTSLFQVEKSLQEAGAAVTGTGNELQTVDPFGITVELTVYNGGPNSYQ